MTQEPDVPIGDERDITDILGSWTTDAGSITARRITGADGLEQIQLRIPMGLLQMYPDGRPDGARPHGRQTALDWLREVVKEDPAGLTAEHWAELDREIMQFYHRRIALLSLAEAERREEWRDQAAADYARIVRDADHNLAIMDFIKAHATDEEFVESHEQYRSFVMGHRTVAAGLYWICRNQPVEAIDVILVGLSRLREAYERHGDADSIRRDPTAARLVHLVEQLRREHSIVKTPHEELSEAVAAEEFEKAARIRDQIRTAAAGLKPPFKA